MTYTIKVKNGLPQKNRLVALWGFMWDITQIMVLFRHNVFCLWHDGENVTFDCNHMLSHAHQTNVLTHCGAVASCGVIDMGHRSLYHLTTCCLTAPSHYLTQCRLIVDTIPMTNFNFNSFSVIMIVLLIRKLHFKWVIVGAARAKKTACLHLSDGHNGSDAVGPAAHKIWSEVDIHIAGTVAQSTQINDVLFYCPLVDVAAILDEWF